MLTSWVGKINTVLDKEKENKMSVEALLKSPNSGHLQREGE